jgi:hypothetical protein
METESKARQPRDRENAATKGVSYMLANTLPHNINIITPHQQAAAAAPLWGQWGRHYRPGEALPAPLLPRWCRCRCAHCVMLLGGGGCCSAGPA